MLVKDVLKSPVISIAPETTLADAYRTMQERTIRHLPVVDGGRLVGLVTDRDLRLATSALATEPFPPGVRVGEVMTKSPTTADAADPVEEAARTMREKRIGCLPIVEDGRLAGIITTRDLLEALMRMTGVEKPSSRLEVRLPDRPGELARLTGLVAARALNVHSLLTSPEAGESVRVVLRVGTIETRALARDLRAAGFDVLWPPDKSWPR
jgi:acetoin utilization protein AcuB